nr:NAD-dependent epimerase/dehydratase family protein [Spirochaetota bacterium]
MDKKAKIFVAGHRGLVGSAIVRILQKNGYDNLVLKTSKEVDLTDFNAVNNLFKTENIEYVFLAAAKVGGILANNDYKGEFIYQNLQ